MMFIILILMILRLIIIINKNLICRCIKIRYKIEYAKFVYQIANNVYLIYKSVHPVSKDYIY